MFKEGVLVEPKLGVPNAGLDVAVVEPKAVAPKAGAVAAVLDAAGVPQGDWLLPRPDGAPNAPVDGPEADGVPNDVVGLAVPKAEPVLDVPKADEPKAGCEGVPKAGVGAAVGAGAFGVVWEPPTTTRPGYAVPCLIESI